MRGGGQESLERLHPPWVAGEVAGPLPTPLLADTLGKSPQSFVTSSSPSWAILRAWPVIPWREGEMAVPPPPPTPYFPLARAKERSEKSEGALARGIQLFQRLNFPGPDESL